MRTILEPPSHHAVLARRRRQPSDLETRMEGCRFTLERVEQVLEDLPGPLANTLIMPLSTWRLMHTLGLYDPCDPIPFLEHVRSTNPRPVLR